MARDAQTELRDRVYSDYRQRTPESAALFDRAKRVLPGGVSGNLRYIEPYPLYMRTGRGSQITDVDGHAYIDCFGCNGPMLLGHNHPEVLRSIASVAEMGSLLVNPEILIDCAEQIVKLVPCAERVRFLNTGTEAVMTAMRFARAHTGRNKVLKFRGHYHGQHDPVLFGLDATDNRFGDGIPEQLISGTMLAKYGDLNQVTKILSDDHDIAAVMLDPAMHAGGLWGSDKRFLVELRRLTEKHGIVLIFDEVITGFRVAPGGAQQAFGITPDLVTFAKALAAGEKLAVVAGKEEIMRVVDPHAEPGTPRVFQSGTVNDGSTALAAATAALRVYEKLYADGEYERLADRAARLKKNLTVAFKNHGIGCQVNQIASMLQLYLTDENVTFETAAALDTSLLQLFYTAMINEGVLLSVPSSNHIYLSFAHTDEDIDTIVESANVVLDKYDFRPPI